MSRVTNYLLLASQSSAVQSKLVATLNNRLFLLGHGMGAFSNAEHVAGGTRAIEIGLWLAALNHFGPDQLRPIVREIIFREPMLWHKEDSEAELYYVDHGAEDPSTLQRAWLYRSLWCEEAKIEYNLKYRCPQCHAPTYHTDVACWCTLEAIEGGDCDYKLLSG